MIEQALAVYAFDDENVNNLTEVIHNLREKSKCILNDTFSIHSSEIEHQVFYLACIYWYGKKSSITLV